jgi:hypothetical protein
MAVDSLTPVAAAAALGSPGGLLVLAGAVLAGTVWLPGH